MIIGKRYARIKEITKRAKWSIIISAISTGICWIADMLLSSYLGGSAYPSSRDGQHYYVVYHQYLHETTKAIWTTSVMITIFRYGLFFLTLVEIIFFYINKEIILTYDESDNF